MNISREPVVWRNAIAGVLLAAAQIGVLSSEQVAVVDEWVVAALPTATFVIAVVAALLARKRTVPTTTESTAPRELVRGADGVYRTAAEESAEQITRRADLRQQNSP